MYLNLKAPHLSEMVVIVIALIPFDLWTKKYSVVPDPVLPVRGGERSQKTFFFGALGLSIV